MNPKTVTLRNGREATIRDAEPKDLGDVKALYRSGLRKAGHSRKLRVSEVDECHSLVEPPDAGMTFVAKLGERLVGIIAVRKSKPDAIPHAPWWICLLVVHSKFRRLGVGTSLMTTAMSEAKDVLEAEKIGLRVRRWRKSRPARRLYKKLGFAVAENAKGNPKLVMVRNF